MSRHSDNRALVQLSHLPKKEGRLVIGRMVAGSIADHLFWASDGLPVELVFSESSGGDADFYLDQAELFQGELRLYHGSSRKGRLVWRGEQRGVKGAIRTLVESLRPAPSPKKQLAKRMKELESRTRGALAELQRPWDGSPYKAKMALQSIAEELEAVATELDAPDQGEE